MILIDAEFPKTCNDCPLWYYDDDCCHQYCVLTDEEITDIRYLGKDGECPLVNHTIESERKE